MYIDYEHQKKKKTFTSVKLVVTVVYFNYKSTEYKKKTLQKISDYV